MTNSERIAKEVAEEIKLKGFAMYKASIVVASNKLDGWFMDKNQTTAAPSVSELLFDLDSLQINRDYDNGIKRSTSRLLSGKAFKSHF